jgi:hypothetical protein
MELKHHQCSVIWPSVIRMMSITSIITRCRLPARHELAGMGALERLARHHQPRGRRRLRKLPNLVRTVRSHGLIPAATQESCVGIRPSSSRTSEWHRAPRRRGQRHRQPLESRAAKYAGWVRIWEIGSTQRESNRLG